MGVKRTADRKSSPCIPSTMSTVRHLLVQHPSSKLLFLFGPLTSYLDGDVMSPELHADQLIRNPWPAARVIMTPVPCCLSTSFLRDITSTTLNPAPSDPNLLTLILTSNLPVLEPVVTLPAPKAQTYTSPPSPPPPPREPGNRRTLPRRCGGVV